MQRRYLSIYFLASTASLPQGLDLRSVSLFCKRYTPLVSIDEPLGIVLDTTGCEALFGGEQALLSCVKEEMGALGFSVHAALAPTPFCARAMARFRPNVAIRQADLPQALYQLPVEALELEDRVHQTLHELGIDMLLELFRLPRAQLLARFGASLINRIDEIRGDKKDVRFFEPEVQDWFIEEALCETVRDSGYLCEIVLELLKRLCRVLSLEGLGIQKLELNLTHVDRHKSQIDVGVVRPSCDAEKLFRLLKLKLEHLDAGLGVESVVLRAAHTKKLAPQKISLSYEDLPADTDLSALFDTLLNRIGEKNVFRLTHGESHIPEQNHKKVDVNTPGVPACASNDFHTARPTRLLKHPEPIEVIAMLPDSPPRRIVWRRQIVFNVIKADGPERIESEWWRAASAETRDYYRIEDSRGLRLWVFKKMTPDNPFPVWFLHGLLA